MKWFHIPALIVILIPSCSLMVENDAFFDGAAKNAGAAGMSLGGAPTDAGSGGMSESAGAAGAQAGAESEAGTSGSAGGCNLPPTTLESEACGACGAGMRTRTLQLMEDCSYAASEWSACDAQTQCAPGQVEMGQQACGACSTGKQTRSRTCSGDTCTWGAWGAWGACGGVTAACTPGQTSACSNGDSCGQRVCNSKCAWDGCTPKISGGCLRIGPGHTDEGSNFRCCGSDKWQFCLSTCHWSTSCEACGSECSC